MSVIYWRQRVFVLHNRFEKVGEAAPHVVIPNACQGDRDTDALLSAEGLGDGRKLGRLAAGRICLLEKEGNRHLQDLSDRLETTHP